MSTGNNILIYGASSTIAQSVARQLSPLGYDFFLVARSEKKLESIAKDLSARGAGKIVTHTQDLQNLDQHDQLWKTANQELGTIQRVLICHGVLENQSLAEKDFCTAENEIKTNFLSIVSILTPVANQMETDGSVPSL